MKLILVGFGTVGQGVARLLLEKGALLRERYHFDAQIVGVATGSRGIIADPDGLDLSALVAAAAAGTLADYSASEGLRRDFADARQLIAAMPADVMVEVSPTDIQTAQPALSYFEAALAAGQHIVTANKGPLALAPDDLHAAARAAGVQLRYEATVMAGTPTIATGVELLAGCEMTAVRGILNGTTNYMLTQMEGGLSYAEALAQAQALGYAETDPTADVGGWDAAAKVLILSAALFGKSRTLDELDVTGITEISAADIATAQAANERYKLIATITPDGGRVAPERLPLSDPLAQIGGATNAVTFSTDLMGDITLQGAGAGGRETAFAILADLLALHRCSPND